MDIEENKLKEEDTIKDISTEIEEREEEKDVDLVVHENAEMLEEIEKSTEIEKREEEKDVAVVVHENTEMLEENGIITQLMSKTPTKKVCDKEYLNGKDQEYKDPGVETEEEGILTQLLKSAYKEENTKNEIYLRTTLRLLEKIY